MTWHRIRQSANIGHSAGSTSTSSSIGANRRCTYLSVYLVWKVSNTRHATNNASQWVISWNSYDLGSRLSHDRLLDRANHLLDCSFRNSFYISTQEVAFVVVVVVCFRAAVGPEVRWVHVVTWTCRPTRWWCLRFLRAIDSKMSYSATTWKMTGEFTNNALSCAGAHRWLRYR